jgi:hypothetical protein
VLNVDPRNYGPQVSESAATDEVIKSEELESFPGADGSAQGAA